MMKNFICTLTLLNFVGSDSKFMLASQTGSEVYSALSETIKILSVEDISFMQIFITHSTSKEDENLNRFLRKSNFMSFRFVKLGAKMKTKASRSLINLFWLQDEAELGEIFRNNTDSSISNNNELFLVFVNAEIKICNLADVFKSFSSFAIYNANVLAISGDDVVMASFLPFQETQKCRNSIPIIINVYNKTARQWNSDVIFPNKLRNFHECPLRISTLEYPPAVMKKLNNGTAQYYGSDVEVIKGLSTALKFTVNFSHVAEPYNFGEIFENNSTGAISHVVSGDADIVIGFYFLFHNRLKYLSHSYP